MKMMSRNHLPQILQNHRIIETLKKMVAHGAKSMSGLGRHSTGTAPTVHTDHQQPWPISRQDEDQPMEPTMRTDTTTSGQRGSELTPNTGDPSPQELPMANATAPPPPSTGEPEPQPSAIEQAITDPIPEHQQSLYNTPAAPEPSSSSRPESIDALILHSYYQLHSARTKQRAFRGPTYDLQSVQQTTCA